MRLRHINFFNNFDWNSTNYHIGWRIFRHHRPASTTALSPMGTLRRS